MDTVRCIPGFRLLHSFSTMISYTACHYHLRIKFPNTTPSVGGTNQKLWVLLTRHVTDTKKSSDYIALRVESEFDRGVSQQKIDRIAEAVSRTGLVPTWVRSSDVGYSLGLIHQFDACVSKSSRYMMGGPACWILIISAGASIRTGDPRRLTLFDRLIRWGGGGSRVYSDRVFHNLVTLVGRNPNKASVCPQSEDRSVPPLSLTFS